MNKTLKDDIQYLLVSGIIVSFLLIISFVWLTAFNNLSDKEKEVIIILQMAGQQQ